jgi:sarcosine oxidase subunit alpha
MSPVFAGFTQVPATHRLETGGLVDRGTPLPFTFDGKEYCGLAGDTLASALMANGVRLLGRSFKYHRPRGLVAAGMEEPNALVELRSGARREPNIPATIIDLYAGLEARSQNRFPSLSFDLMAVNGLAGPIFAAGFYYKTFMWPAALWERLYEPLIRRAAGLGRAATMPDPDHYDRGYLHADVLVVGAGAAGLTAALTAGRAGARVILADQDSTLGGRLLGERDLVDGVPGADWTHAVAAELRAMPNVRVMTRTTVFGAYDGGFCAVERNADHLPEPEGRNPRQTYWRIAARRSIVAAGAIERPLVFPGNDRPGVMLAGAVRTYLNRFAAVPGRRAVVVTSGEDGWRTVSDLQSAGIEVAAVVDRRADISPRPDTQVFATGQVSGTSGRLGLEAVTVTDSLGQQHVIRADLLAMAGGWTPNLALAAQMAGGASSRPHWDPELNAFLAGDLPPGMAIAGTAAGRFGLADALEDGAREGHSAAVACGFDGAAAPPPAALREKTANAPVWLMPGKKAFVDFQHDVTSDDVALAHREGFRSVEHLKRYTTLGMATDQGKLSNVNGLAMMAAITGAGIAATGTTMFRAPTSPVTIGALAGHSVGPDLRPTRLTPAHDWAVAQGAIMIETGAWLRAGWFPRAGEDWLAACDREVQTTRSAAGLCDVSTLGKIELVGPDVGAFLDQLYVNTLSTLKPGRVRYGLMLREDGFVFDDGTVARIEQDRWLMTTTTAQAAAVLAHMEFCHQVLWPGLAVAFASVTDQWAQFSVAGPMARQVLAAVVDGDVSDVAIPYMGCAVMRAAGAVCRVFRISFSGELAYEIAVPARSADALVQALMAAGAPLGMVPYGTEALGVMRIEKGHPAGGELNGQTTARDLGMARMMSTKKDFIGRALAQRPALISPDRPALVGLLPVDRSQRIRAGAHLLPLGAKAAPENDEGWISSAAHSPSLGCWIALGMLKNGPDRIGQRVLAWDHIRHAETEVEVVKPCFVDPEGVRLRG